MDSEAAASSAAQSAPAAAAVAPAPTPRRSGRSRTRSKRLSDASTASAPAAAHAASIDDDEEKRSDAAAAASASNLSNKRARTTKHTAAAAAAASSSSAAAAQSSPMIRILGRDTGAQFVLCELLTLKEIAQLHQCCRSWRRWINEGAFGSNRLLQFESTVPLSLRSSAWAPRYVQRLALGLVPSAAAAKSHPLQPQGAACEQGLLDEIALRLLPRLNHLRALQLVLRLPDDPVAVPPTLSLTSATLTSLVIDLRSWSSEQDPFTPSFLRSLGGLPSLTSLRIASDEVHRHFADLDFSVLPALTQLQQLSILPERVVRCSPAQLAALVSCRALTALDVGVWGPVDETPDEDDEDGELAADDAAQRKAGLIKLIHERNLNGAARLRKIGLGTLEWQSVVTPAVAEVLLTLHDLESLEHVVWSSALTSEHWAQLSLFTRLHTIHIGAVSEERTENKELAEEYFRASLQLDAPLLALQHCPLLSSLSVTGCYSHGLLVLSSEHAVLLAALPRLQSLSLRDVYMESLAPLTSAPALTHLMLDGCSGLGGQSFSMRAIVPPLPLLTSLSIEDDPECELHHGERPSKKYAAVNKAMMKRLPLLRPGSFRHQWWSTNLHGRQSAPRNAALTARPPPALRI